VDPVALAARGESVWHRLALGAFGIGWLDDGTVAWRMAPSSPVFLGAVSLRAGVPAERLAGAVERLAGELAVRDAGGTEDLGPFGFALQAREPWMLRPPGPVPEVDRPPGLVVAPCRTPAEVEVFERTSVEAFTGSLSSWVPGSVHPPASVAVSGLTLLLASVDGHPVGTAIAASDGTVLNLAGVAVLKSARRQGIGTAVTAACLAIAPTLPAVLSSSEEGHPVYRSLGFTDAGPSALWWRPTSRAT
jgi:GNAT superfamily N-acetyltransferase